MCIVFIRSVLTLTPKTNLLIQRAQIAEIMQT